MPSLRVAAVAGLAIILACASAPPIVSPLGAEGLRPATQAKAAQAKPAEAKPTQAKPAPGQPAQDSKVQKPPTAKLAEPFPDEATLAKRRADAESRALFKTYDPLVFTLAADFKAVNRERDPESTKTFPAVLTVPGPAGEGAPATLDVTLRSRGILRLNARVCGFVPLRIDFPKKVGKATVFDGQEKLKMVTHCEESALFDQYVLAEYLAYRLHNLMTPLALRVRLVRATYVDSTTGKTLSTHNAFLIEDEDDLARRMGGRALEIPRMQFKDFDLDAFTTAMLFQFMIGNTDFSIYTLHNMHQLQTSKKVFYPIIWDYDVSGLVNPRYSAPDPKLDLTSLRERLYRGPCRTMEQYEPLLAVFRSKETDAMALVGSIPGLAPDRQRDATAYLKEFYTLLGKKDQLKRALVDKCIKQATM